MFEKNKKRKKIIVLWPAVLCLLLLFGTGCKDRDKIYTVGIAIHVPAHLEAVEVFKGGMAELGYMDGKDIRYIYDKPLGSDQEVIDAEIKRLLSQDVDLLFTLGNDISLRAKKAVEGTNIPVIAVSVFRPAEIGLVDSISHPGGNVTGVWVTDTIAKMLELLSQIIPQKKNIWLPYNASDPVSIIYLEKVEKAASEQEFDLVSQDISSVTEALVAIDRLPKDIGAIFRVPSPTLDPRNNELSQAAIKRGIPMCAVLALDESVLISLSGNLSETGIKAARLAHEIMLGAKPAEFPMVSSDPILTVNLKTAEEIGIHIPDDILLWATNIIR